MSDHALALTDAKRTWRWMLVIGSALILAGLAALGRPLAAGVAVTIFVGWLMIFAGASHLLGALACRGFGQLILRLVLAFTYIGAGTWLLSTSSGVVPSAWEMGVTFGIGQAGVAVVLYFNVERSLELPREHREVDHGQA